MVFSLLIFLPAFLNADGNLLHNFEQGILSVDRNLLEKTVSQSFSILDCNGQQISGLDSMLSELEKFPVDLPMKRFKVIEKNQFSFKIDVNNGEMMNEYEYSHNGEEFIILNEKQSKCNNKTYLWYSTSLINYDELFKRTAKSLLEEYKQNLINHKNDMENILDRNYFMLPCGFRNFNLEQYKKQLSLLHENVVVYDISYSQIQQLTVDENGEIFFKYDGKTIFKARFVEEENKYKITSEQQTFCPTEPFLTFLINDNSTGRNIATDAVAKLIKATMDQELPTVINGKLETINCENQQTEEIPSGGKFVSRTSFKDSIKQGSLKYSNNQLNSSTKTLGIVLSVKESETGKPIKVYIDVNLENRKFNLKLDECF